MSGGTLQAHDYRSFCIRQLLAPQRCARHGQQVPLNAAIAADTNTIFISDSQ